MSTHKNHHPARKKAQVLAPDFLMGAAMFSLIIIICVTLWNISYEKTSWLSESEEMQRRAFFITNTLLNSPGTPDDWNTTTVVSLGLRETATDKLETDKLLEFTFMPYEESREMMGLGPYQYFMNFTINGTMMKTEGAVKGTVALLSSKNFNDMVKTLLMNYGNVWDYYRAENNPAEPDSETLRDIYWDSNEQQLLDIYFMPNLTSYDTVIIEGLQNNVMTGDYQLAIRNFVADGGTLIAIKDDVDAQMISHFPGINPESTTAGDLEGTVVSRDLLIPRLGVGTDMIFESKKYKFNSTEVDKAIVASKDTPEYCLVCMWEYGDGRIYYIPDAADDEGHALDGLDFDGIELFFGSMDMNIASNIVPVRRIIMYEDNGDTKQGIMNFYIYN